jgi:hypothetical protein
MVINFNSLAGTHCSLPCGQNKIRVPEIISFPLPSLRIMSCHTVKVPEVLAEAAAFVTYFQ